MVYYLLCYHDLIPHDYMKFLLTIAFTFTSVLLYTQQINQLDSNGERHGLWKKTYEGQEQLRFEGTFEHGKEVGVFKHYKPKNGKQPSAIITYVSNSNLAQAEYYAKNGKLLSKGQLKGRNRFGVWEYYHSNSKAVMMHETYDNNVLNGTKTTYYDNGQINEVSYFKNDKKNGDYYLYSLKGVLLQHLQYKEDQLHGTIIYFNGKGEKIAEGTYTDGIKNPDWIYYREE